MQPKSVWKLLDHDLNALPVILTRFWINMHLANGFLHLLNKPISFFLKRYKLIKIVWRTFAGFFYLNHDISILSPLEHKYVENL